MFLMSSVNSPQQSSTTLPYNTVPGEMISSDNPIGSA